MRSRLEIGLDRRLVEIAAALPQLLGVIAPVPRLELEIAAVLLDQRLHGVAVGERARARRRPHRIEELRAPPAACCAMASSSR